METETGICEFYTLMLTMASEDGKNALNSSEITVIDEIATNAIRFWHSHTIIGASVRYKIFSRNAITISNEIGV